MVDCWLTQLCHAGANGTLECWGVPEALAFRCASVECRRALEFDPDWQAVLLLSGSRLRSIGSCELDPRQWARGYEKVMRFCIAHPSFKMRLEISGVPEDLKDQYAAHEGLNFEVVHTMPTGIIASIGLGQVLEDDAENTAVDWSDTPQDFGKNLDMADALSFIVSFQGRQDLIAEVPRNGSRDPVWIRLGAEMLAPIINVCDGLSYCGRSPLRCPCMKAKHLSLQLPASFFVALVGFKTRVLHHFGTPNVGLDTSSMEEDEEDEEDDEDEKDDEHEEDEEDEDDEEEGEDQQEKQDGEQCPSTSSTSSLPPPPPEPEPTELWVLCDIWDSRGIRWPGDKSNHEACDYKYVHYWFHERIPQPTVCTFEDIHYYRMSGIGEHLSMMGMQDCLCFSLPFEFSCHHTKCLKDLDDFHDIGLDRLSSWIMDGNGVTLYQCHGLPLEALGSSKCRFGKSLAALCFNRLQFVSQSFQLVLSPIIASDVLGKVHGERWTRCMRRGDLERCSPPSDIEDGKNFKKCRQIPHAIGQGL